MPDISLIDKSLLDGLSEQEKKVLLDTLSKLSEGDNTLLNELTYADFAEIPVDVETFLHDKKYLGNGLIDAEGRFTLFPYWEEMLKKLFPNNMETRYNNLILTGAIGLGKAQPLDSLVLGKDGFIKMGDIKVGDLVFGADGNTHKVLGVFPQGERDIYKITFSDRTSTECSDEHLWTVYDKHQHYAKKVLTTKQLSEYKLSRIVPSGYKNRKFLIPMTSPINFQKREHVISPYTLGCLIGDGGLTTRTIGITSADEEIVNKISESLHDDYCVRKVNSKMYGYTIAKKVNTCTFDGKTNPIPTPNIYRLEIDRFGLNCKTYFKYIPDEYLIDCVENRIELLHGLMDTDGYVDKSGSVVQFSTASSRLKDDFVWLVESLGGTCRVTEKKCSYKRKDGERVPCHNSFVITLKLPKQINPFSLQRKRDRVNKNRINPVRAIDSIEYIGRKECQCIYIDSDDHLYLTNNFIATHNTMVAVVCMLYLLYRMLCLKDPYLYYGLQPIDKITFSLINVTIEAAKGVAWDKLQQLVQSSPWFMSHGKMSGRTDIIWTPDKRIELVVGSSNNAVIGRAVFCLDGNTEILTDKGYEKMKSLVDKKIRVVSYDNGKLYLSSQCTVKPTGVSDTEYHIELEDGTVIKCTENHKFLLKKLGYIQAKDLVVGDIMVGAQPDLDLEVTGVSIVTLKEPKQFYDVVEASPLHNFIVKTICGNIVSHNCNFTDKEI